MTDKLPDKTHAEDGVPSVSENEKRGDGVARIERKGGKKRGRKEEVLPAGRVLVGKKQIEEEPDLSAP